MERDFVTRQHIDSLAGHHDPSLSEILNNYKSQPFIPPAQNFSGFSGHPGPTNHGDAVMLSALLGHLNANVNSLRSPEKSTFDGIQLNVNSEVLRWIVVLLLVVLLVWLFLKFTRKRKNPLKKKVRELERQIQALSRKNPAISSEEEDAFEEE